MAKPNDKKRPGGSSEGISKAITPTKKNKPIANSPKSKPKHNGSARKHLPANAQEPPVPKPVSNEDISSNWKSFLQVAAASPAEPERRRARARGLARRGCSCPPPVWFDGVDPALLHDDRPPCSFCLKQRERERPAERPNEQEAPPAKPKARLPSHYIAMDCEMVGVGHSGQENMLARVSIVNSLCQPIYDKFVKPMERVTDYRTSVSGVRPKDLVNGESFEVVQKEVAALLKGRVLVGHAVYNDLRVLLLSHPKRHTRDTSSYKPFRRMFNGSIPSLKNLAHKILAVDIQKGEHDSVQDARATMQVYQTHRREWEAALAERHRQRSGRPA
ncbi:RNA exonuclease 4-like [Pollicipes pollicipes]|uniref:RNA exonuclease 4-like n=1 Tax=Pollicipes pollicipes TaxID=41117 RepID=UPI0018859BDA|nr:RNA exonuclease 4-like [Pollicipes pollicipes]XP_037087306.1 RNA exonuclease 4-like [Pollicipes pollicipes]XP_037087307.1 RNA exonuclease 4-like [Pollicipes pollicipes]XP_037087308.1 RNA exonuclease 4-like [Pollicipes pollicipes]XP_037087309.1 RNA exonuclease 4-like [Pollicipes pollicipes]XP_037087310.1 RNA exonuclease 4-like [Pollicipes pollicipes]XP_037087311.1 RNA exonuclease 4-like [Pollicipes pollicipes]